MDESDLVARARDGDERAFRLLVEPHIPALELHAYRMLGSTVGAEDVVQETLLRAWRGLRRFEGRASFRTWLYRITTNACLDEIELARRRPDVIEPYPDARIERFVSADLDPGARYDVRESVELAFLAALRLLPGRQRAVLLLRDVLDWSAAEVAELLDTTVAAVNSALQRARATVAPAVPTGSGRSSDRDRDELLARYVDAWERRDVDALVALLRADAELVMPPEQSVVGGVVIAEFFRSRLGGTRPAEVHLVATTANGNAAVVMHEVTETGALAPHGVLVFERCEGSIVRIAAFIDPRLADAFAVDMAAG